MDGDKTVRGQFIWRTGEDRARVIESIKQKIDSGYFSSRTVTSEIVEKIWGNFSSIAEG